MKLLLTGANGQVGQALQLYARCQAIDTLAYAKEDFDISSSSMVNMTLNRHRPDIVINAAAYTNVEKAEIETTQAYLVNAEGVKNLGAVCQKLDIPFIHLSTDYVFSGEKQTPYVESDDTAPLSAYGMSKLEGEKILRDALQKHIILRTSWVFSATGNNFVKTMWRLFHEREHVNIVNDQWGAPTSADAIAQALLKIAFTVLKDDFNAWGIYHFSGEPKTTWYDFACAIHQACCSSEKLKLQALHPISTIEFPSKVRRPAHAVLSMEKIKKTFDIDPCDWKKDLYTVMQQLQQGNPS